jgi:hypothetical protein
MQIFKSGIYLTDFLKSFPAFNRTIAEKPLDLKTAMLSQERVFW